MLVTITTDASFYDGPRVGAYAFWITSNLGRITHADSFRGEINSSDEAEMKCILNALHVLSKQPWVITDVIINTDSKGCIHLITQNKHSRWGNELRIRFNDVVKTLKLTGTVTFKHVKGHKHNKTARHWCNDWCDKQAKIHAKKKIRELNLAKQK